MTRRSAIKWLHWFTFALLLYFFIVEPDENQTDPGGALSTHAGMGILLGLVVAIWVIMFWRKGAAGRPGPKLPGWAKRVHPVLNKGLYHLLPVMLATGLFAGLAAPYLIEAFGLVPINFAGGSKSLHGFAEDIHELVFDLLLLLSLAHIVFHVWRHVRVKDNALRIMAPKILHKYL